MRPQIRGLMGLSIVLVMVCLFTCTVGWGQTGTTAINGNVSDPQGNSIAGAAVTVTPVGSQAGRSVETDESGHYQMQALPPGVYAVRVESKGFRAVVRENVDRKSVV